MRERKCHKINQFGIWWKCTCISRPNFNYGYQNEMTASKVWQWNINGLGYSSNGVNGPYEIAMTKDGRIVADFITTEY